MAKFRLAVPVSWASKPYKSRIAFFSDQDPWISHVGKPFLFVLVLVRR